MLKPNVTMQEIADRLGVSLKSVSLAVNGAGRLSQKTRERILQAAREMGYRPNFAARSLVTRRSCLIGVLLPYSNSSFFGDIMTGIEKKAHEHGFMLLLGNPSGGREELRSQILRFAERGVDGVAVYPSGAIREVTDELCSLGVPIVQVMNRLPELGRAAVMVDNEEAGRCAARHLLAVGHSRAGMLTHDRGGEEIAARRRGFVAGLGREIPCEECAIGIDAGYAAARKLFAAHPELTALFAASDLAALGALKAGLELGRRVPREFAVIGFDNLDVAGQQLIYPLTTLAQPKERIGELAGSMLINLLEGRDAGPVILEAPLIIRSTTAVSADRQ